jgi:type IV pilus assembly protein PilX
MTRPSDPSQRGVSLIVVLLILVVVSVLGVGGAQIATMAERGSRNDRDMQVAWQSAEAALTDAEFDIHGPNTAAGNRRSVFKDMRDINLFVAGCGTSGTSKGLCTLVETGKPAWLTVDFTIDAATARTTALGVQPAKAPRYIIEPIVDVLERDLGTGTGKPPSFVYRVTAMGFGPRADIQAMTQMMYRD